MPTYEYACRACGEHLEVVQSFKDEALTVCPNCHGELRKVFGSIGIAFKGSGFYKTDNRGKSASAAAKTGDAKTGEAKSGESKTGESKTGESKSGESKSGESKSGESTSGESKSGESRSSGPSSPPAAASAS